MLRRFSIQFSNPCPPGIRLRLIGFVDESFYVILARKKHEQWAEHFTLDNPFSSYACMLSLAALVHLLLGTPKYLAET